MYSPSVRSKIAGIMVGIALSILTLSSESAAKTVKVQMEAVETEVVIDGEGTRYSAWTFNGQFPGPVIRVQEGDSVEFTLNVVGILK